ncbi:MAG: hypothetical protein ABWW69_00030 [Pyrodictiaceae archaeon]
MNDEETHARSKCSVPSDLIEEAYIAATLFDKPYALFYTWVQSGGVLVGTLIRFELPVLSDNASQPRLMHYGIVLAGKNYSRLSSLRISLNDIIYSMIEGNKFIVILDKNFNAICSKLLGENKVNWYYLLSTNLEELTSQVYQLVTTRID